MSPKSEKSELPSRYVLLFTLLCISGAFGPTIWPPGLEPLFPSTRHLTSEAVLNQPAR